MKYFLLVLGMTALLWGLVSLTYRILWNDYRRDGALMLLPVRGHTEDIELRVRRAARNARLTGTALIIADFGADAETAEICRRLCMELDGTEFVSSGEVFRIFY